MRVLLDTHAFLWWITDDPKLSLRAGEIIKNMDNEVFVSAASGWELVIKTQLGRLKISENPIDFIREQIQLNAFQSLAIRMNHALQIFSLPGHHKDPFDRLLVAQAQVEEMSILTADPQIARYDVAVIW